MITFFQKRAIRWGFFLGAIALLWYALFFLSSRESDGAFELIAPSLVQSVEAAQTNSVLAQIQNEAGIAAYYDAATTVNLSLAKNAFRTIDLETNDYILGSVSPTGFTESEDVHVYVSSDGWFLAYYLAADPAAKSIDMVKFVDSGYTAIQTKQETVMELVATEAGIVLGTPGYYDFRNPNANEMLLVAENDGGPGNQSFTLNIPISIIVYERSYYGILFDTSSCPTDFYLDGNVVIDNLGCSIGLFSYGTLTTAELPSGVDHVFSMTTDRDTHNFGAALVYTK